MVVTNNCLVSVPYMPRTEILSFYCQRTSFFFSFPPPYLELFCIHVKVVEDIFKTTSLSKA